jgi:tetratricopeptide (TPR) repeat protein
MESSASEGFDLDAISTEPGDDVVYELGGGASLAGEASAPKDEPLTEEANNDKYDPIAASEEDKQKGNECFKRGSYLDAIDFYTDAIEGCPGMKGEELLELLAKHEEQERERADQRYQRVSDRRLADRNLKNRNSDDDNDAKSENNVVNDGVMEDEDDLAAKEFISPSHPYGKNLAIYNSNKAASLMHLGRYSEAMTSCNIAVLVDPTYPKAYIRRMTCHEQTKEIELALRDAKKALELSSGNKDIKAHVKRLEKLEAERMENLKDETMGKLKDLGNSILGNFGMSMDNFKAEKDPSTGSYSIKMV